MPGKIPHFLNFIDIDNFHSQFYNTSHYAAYLYTHNF